MFRKISSAAADALSFSSPFTRPRKATPLTSRKSTSLLQMFRKISSAAAGAHSFSSLASPPNGKLSSLFTRPPKLIPLTSRNSTSLLLLFRKISSAAAAHAHSFSSPFTRPPKPTPLTSRNSTSLFTYAENSHDEPKIGVATARLLKFFKTDCKSGNVSADEAFRLFDRMVQMKPRFRLYSFNLLLNGLAKNKRYYDVVSFYGKMDSTGLSPSLITLNILLNCSSNANRVFDALLVRILRQGYGPTIVPLSSLNKGLCIGSRVEDALLLFRRLEEFGYHRGGTITYDTLFGGVCRWRNTRNALKLHEEEMVSENGQCGARCKYYSCINERLCKGSFYKDKEGKEHKAAEELVFSDSDIDAIIGDISHFWPCAWLRLFCNTIAHCVLNELKGQAVVNPNIHSKEKAPACLAWETPHDELQDIVNSIRSCPP